MSVPLTVCVKLCTKRNPHKRHHSNTNHTMPKSAADTEARKRRKLSADEVWKSVRNGDASAMRVALEKFPPDSRTPIYNAVRELYGGNHDECLALLLPYVKTTQMCFGMWLSECVHTDHVACTDVLLQHWKSVCSNGACVRLCGPIRYSACPAMWVDPAVCRVFIDAGADIETKTSKGGRSPLHLASRSGALEVVKMLVRAGAGVNVTDDDGNTCLFHAAGDGHTETVRYLVGLPEVDVNHCDMKNKTALHCAADEGHTDVVRVLIDAGADIDTDNNDGHSPLHSASTSGALDVVKVLVRAGAGVDVTDDNGDTLLILAAYFGHTETVRYLVGLPEVDVNHCNSQNVTALHCAAKKGHTKVVRVLIDAGADIDTRNDDGRSPLHCASTSGSLEVVKMLVEAGAGVDVTDDCVRTCLIFAAYYGHTETVRYLVGLPEVDVNHCDSQNETALHYAAKKGHAEVVQVLIDAGADIDTRNNDGHSPLHCASTSGALEVVKVLVEAGARANVTDDDGRTCLFLAASKGRTETVRYLVGLPEVDVNHCNRFNDTALHCAVKGDYRWYADVVQVLIDAGADIDAKNEDGHSPLHLAVREPSKLEQQL